VKSEAALSQARQQVKVLRSSPVPFELFGRSIETIIRSTNINRTEYEKGIRQMNKAELIESIAKMTKLTKVDAEAALNSTLETIKKSVKKGDDVTLIGFGTFTRAKRKARTGRNPQTGKEIKIPATTVPKFRPGREFKDILK